MDPGVHCVIKAMVPFTLTFSASTTCGIVPGSVSHMEVRSPAYLLSLGSNPDSVTY